MWDLILSVPDHFLSFYFGCGFCLCRFLDFSVFLLPTAAASLPSVLFESLTSFKMSRIFNCYITKGIVFEFTVFICCTLVGLFAFLFIMHCHNDGMITGNWEVFTKFNEILPHCSLLYYQYLLLSIGMSPVCTNCIKVYKYRKMIFI